MRRIPVSLYMLALVIFMFGLFIVRLLFTHKGAACVSIFACTFAGTLLLLIGIGLQVTGAPLGAIAGARNTYSLSRLQMGLWTLVIFSGLIAAIACRAWGLAEGASANPAIQSMPANSALDVYIAPEIYAALGISYFTGAAAPALLSVKANAPTRSDKVVPASVRLGETIVPEGNIFQRPMGAIPRLGDLVQGDDLDTAGTVDLSKVQQLLFTLVLVGAYLVMLVSWFHGQMHFPAVNPPKDVAETSSVLPMFSANFVYLLALSHAGYLDYKAASHPNVTHDQSATETGRMRGPPTPERR